MSEFADSSALVKWYSDEPGADEVRAVTAFVVSGLARVEVPAALWRKVRTGRLDAASAALLVQDFEADWHAEPSAPRLLPVGVTPAVLESAARAAAVHGLRAYDAVQLASALAARAAAPVVDGMACFDQDLRAAAAAEGFRLLPS